VPIGEHVMHGEGGGPISHNPRRGKIGSPQGGSYKKSGAGVRFRKLAEEKGRGGGKFCRSYRTEMFRGATERTAAEETQKTRCETIKRGKGDPEFWLKYGRGNIFGVRLGGAGEKGGVGCNQIVQGTIGGWMRGTFSSRKKTNTIKKREFADTFRFLQLIQVNGVNIGRRAESAHKRRGPYGVKGGGSGTGKGAHSATMGCQSKNEERKTKCGTGYGTNEIGKSAGTMKSSKTAAL